MKTKQEFILKDNRLKCKYNSENTWCNCDELCTSRSACEVTDDILINKITTNDTKWAIQNLNSNDDYTSTVAKYIIESNK